jgi:hypothetical protein
MWRWLTGRWRRRDTPGRVLLVMRLDCMIVVHPDMDRSHVCARCQQPVGIYPSGQAVLRRDPATRILCHLCQPPTAAATPAPGALRERGQSIWNQPN